MWQHRCSEAGWAKEESRPWPDAAALSDAMPKTGQAARGCASGEAKVQDEFGHVLASASCVPSRLQAKGGDREVNKVGGGKEWGDEENGGDGERSASLEEEKAGLKQDPSRGRTRVGGMWFLKYWELRQRRVYAWGSGSHGQTGALDWNGESLSCAEPVEIVSLRGVGVVAVSCGAAHSACVTESGSVFTWGCGLSGRLGHGDVHDSRLPRHVKGLASVHVHTISLGEAHCLVVGVGQDGGSGEQQCFAWGSDMYGQCGLGSDMLGHVESEQRSAETYWSSPQRVPYAAVMEAPQTGADPGNFLPFPHDIARTQCMQSREAHDVTGKRPCLFAADLFADFGHEIEADSSCARLGRSCTRNDDRFGFLRGVAQRTAAHLGHSNLLWPGQHGAEGGCLRRGEYEGPPGGQDGSGINSWAGYEYSLRRRAQLGYRWWR